MTLDSTVLSLFLIISLLLIAFFRHGLVPLSEPPLWTTTSLHRRSSARKYSLVLLTLFKIKELCLARTFSTRRDLYYNHVADFGRQADADAAVAVASALLGTPRLHLRMLAMTKGLVAGSLSFVNAQGIEVKDEC